MDDNRSLIESLYAAFARRDLDYILSLVSSQILIEQSSALPWGGQYTGHDGLKKFFTTLLQHVESNVEIERMIDATESVVVLGRTRGTVRVTGKSFDVPVAHVWRVQHGKLTHFYPHIDNALMLEALMP